MAKTLDLKNIISEDCLGRKIAENYILWEAFRTPRIQEWQELQEYIFATDTTHTTNSKLPWSNKTVIPKLCQIRDNLHANYMAALFPKRKWLTWIGHDAHDESDEKVEAIETYMSEYVVNRNEYYNTISRLVYDYIDYGNVFTMPEWVDQTSSTKHGYVGPMPRRISPLDIVFNPTAPNFESSPKIIRSLVSMGEVKQMLEASTSSEEEKVVANELYQYLRKVRDAVSNHTGSLKVQDRIYNIAGFDSFKSYLNSGTVEVLTFYGDIYDEDQDTLHKNVVIKVVDRHKLIYNQPSETLLGYPEIFHAGWRLRGDNLWAQGPLDNLVGMQYRIDHLENMKADCFDLIAYPPVVIKGYVEDFNWGPMERIYVGDDGSVELLSPNVQALQADTQIAILEAKMEEMAGSPKEAMGFRTPGEKTKYEVQSLENAAGRIFQNKITWFERHIVENLLNSMLELARRNMGATVVRLFDSEFKVSDFKTLTVKDITGSGYIKPIAARHFAEQTQMIQNITGFFQSAIGADPEVKQHFSSVKIAQAIEQLLEIDDLKLVSPYIRLTEQAETQRLANAHEEQVATETMTATGMNGDFDVDL